MKILGVKTLFNIKWLYPQLGNALSYGSAVIFHCTRVLFLAPLEVDFQQSPSDDDVHDDGADEEFDDEVAAVVDR